MMHQIDASPNVSSNHTRSSFHILEKCWYCTQNPVQQRPKTTACIRCIKDHISGCFAKEHIKLLGCNFTNNHLYNPAFPMVLSPFLQKFFRHHPDTGKLLTKEDGFDLDLDQLKHNAVSKEELKVLKKNKGGPMP